MNKNTRAKLNYLRGTYLRLAIQQDKVNAKKPLTTRHVKIAHAAGLGEAFIARREEHAKRRAASKVARASRKRNRQR